jgi:hypothetical protein
MPNAKLKRELSEEEFKRIQEWAEHMIYSREEELEKNLMEAGLLNFDDEKKIIKNSVM